MDRSPWVVLGVEPGAGAAEIRRAYARRLKEKRPDEDAQGFQRLVEARDLALQLASGARPDGHLTDTFFVEALDIGAMDAARPQHEPATPPPHALAADAFFDTFAQPRAVFDALQGVLESDELTGWQSIVRATSELTHGQRAALEAYLVEGLSAFAARQKRNCAAWPPSTWAFFDLVATLDEEFGWRENDRLLHEVLDEQAAQDFTVLLQWARHLASAGTAAGPDGHSPRPAPIAPRDFHAFYDGGRDQRGLDAYWLMIKDPSLWRPRDAATDLFLPAWRLRDGHYGRTLLGLVGWTALIVALAPWRAAILSEALPWLRALPGDALDITSAILVMAVALWCLMGSAPPQSPQRKTQLVGPLWDSPAFLSFPLWALARRLYVRAAVGLVAWLAVVSHLPASEPDIGILAAIMLVGMLHIAAAEYGLRWAVYKLQRTVAAADRLRILDPGQRAHFLRQHGTRGFAFWPHPSRPDTRGGVRSPSRPGLPRWWKWLMAFAVIAAILRAGEVLWFRG